MPCCTLLLPPFIYISITYKEKYVVFFFSPCLPSRVITVDWEGSRGMTFLQLFTVSGCLTDRLTGSLLSQLKDNMVTF